MIIKDANGKVIGSIEFTEKELDLEKEKFEKITELGNNMLKSHENITISNNNVILTKNSNFHNTLGNFSSLVNNFSNQYYETERQKSMFHYEEPEEIIENQ